MLLLLRVVLLASLEMVLEAMREAMPRRHPFSVVFTLQCSCSRSQASIAAAR
jgi:hypothetical protein